MMITRGESGWVCVWLRYCIFANGEALVLFALKIYGLAIGGALGIGLVDGGV